METYLSILESELGFEIAGMASSDRQKQLSNFTVNRIQALDEQKWRVRLRENHVSVESILTGIANNVLAVKDIVSTAAAADPHVALACAGVSNFISGFTCLFFPVLSRVFQSCVMEGIAKARA